MTFPTESIDVNKKILLELEDDDLLHICKTDRYFRKLCNDSFWEMRTKERYPEEYKELKELIASCYGDPWLENRVFAEYRFKKIDEMSEDKLFTIDQVLAYMAKLLIIEYLLELDEERGKLILDTFKAG